MNKVVLMMALIAGQAQADVVMKETWQCGKEGCEVVCHEPGKAWDSYLHVKENIEVTHFVHSGVRQLKAEVEKGQFTILDTHPEWQSCRISGVVETEA